MHFALKRYAKLNSDLKIERNSNGLKRVMFIEIEITLGYLVNDKFWVLVSINVMKLV
jgi:hypothetical protein